MKVNTHEGSHHWVIQRLSALALIPLSLWFLVCALNFRNKDYHAVVDWISDSWHFAGLLAFTACAVHHSYLGLQVIIEDYVHKKCVKHASLIVLKFLGLGTFILCFSFLIKIISMDH